MVGEGLNVTGRADMRKYGLKKRVFMKMRKVGREKLELSMRLCLCGLEV